MKPRLVFIDDDFAELDEMRSIVSDEYEYCPIRWPFKQSVEHLVGEPPAIFVLDLYFPDRRRNVDQIEPAEWERQANIAKGLGERFTLLYGGSRDGTALLRDTFSCIKSTYDLLWQQCRALRQSAADGRWLLAEIQSYKRYKRVPVVFYSRKANVAESVRALQAGAASVIHKADSPPGQEARESILSQLRLAQSVRHTWKAWFLRALHLNVNVTLFSEEFTLQKTEVTVAKVG